MKTVFFGLMLVAGLACSSLDKIIQKPKVELDHVVLKDTDLNGTTALFIVKVQNPNGVDLKVDDIAYRVFLGGAEFAKASTGKAVNVPANGESLVELPLPVQFSKLMGGVQALLSAKPLDYRIEGDAKLSLFSIPFKNEGQIKLH